MRKPLLSLSGHEMQMPDSERVICILSDVEARPLMTNENNRPVLGGVNAGLVRKALAEQGFVIVHKDQIK